MNSLPPPTQPLSASTAIRHANPAATIIRVPEVSAITGLARPTIYKYLKDDATFPRPVPLSDSKSRGAPVGFILAEVHAWVISRIAKRDQGAAA